MEVSINYVAVFLATLSTLVVGSIWYAKPVFGNLWIKLAKLDEKQMEKASYKPIILTILGTFITAYVLAHFTELAYGFYAGDYSFLVTALLTAGWGWLGFTATRVLTHDAFEGRPTRLTLLTVGHELVTFMVMGLIIGVFGN